MSKKRWRKLAFKIRRNGAYNLNKGPHVEQEYKDKANDFEKKYGFRYEETWNLDHSIACYVLPRLAYLRSHTHGYPSGLAVWNDDKTEIIVDGYEAWLNILDKMIDAFEIVALKEEPDLNDQAVIDEGLRLFAQYFCHLWD